MFVWWLIGFLLKKEHLGIFDQSTIIKPINLKYLWKCFLFHIYKAIVIISKCKIKWLELKIVFSMQQARPPQIFNLENLCSRKSIFFLIWYLYIPCTIMIILKSILLKRSINWKKNIFVSLKQKNNNPLNNDQKLL